jgi:hypothetical protein
MGDWCGSADDRELKREKERVWRGNQMRPIWRSACHPVKELGFLKEEYFLLTGAL